MVDIASAFSGLLVAADASSVGAETRQAMVFTSELRRRIKDAGAAAGPLPPGVQAEFAAMDSHVLLERIPLPINPHNVQFARAKRTKRENTREGSVIFHFTDSKGRNNDLLSMTFTIRTGTLDRRGAEKGAANDVNNTALTNLLIWHNMLLLSQEAVLMPDLTANEFRVEYISPLFPFPLTLTGYFAAPLQFSEVAEEPFMREYSFEFVVTSMDPPEDEFPVAAYTQILPGASDSAVQGLDSLITSSNTPIEVP